MRALVSINTLALAPRTTLKTTVIKSGTIGRCAGIACRDEQPVRAGAKHASPRPVRVLEDTFMNFLEDVARCGDTERSYKLPIRLIKHAALRNAETYSSKGGCARSRCCSEVLIGTRLTRSILVLYRQQRIQIFSAIIIVGMLALAARRCRMTDRTPKTLRVTESSSASSRRARR